MQTAHIGLMSWLKGALMYHIRVEVTSKYIHNLQRNVKKKHMKWSFIGSNMAVLQLICLEYLMK